jgi:hypothetical protein
MRLDRANHVDPVQQIALSEQDGLTCETHHLPKNAIDGYRFALPILRADLGSAGKPKYFCKWGWTGRSPNSPSANQSGVSAVA